MKLCPEQVEDEYRHLWYTAQITLKANGGEDPKKVEALKANYEHSEAVDD